MPFFSRPDNDLLLTEQFAKNDSGLWEITCTKKHYFQVGFVIVVQNANGNSIIECDVKQIVSDKIFCLKGQLISECLFDVLKFSKRPTETFDEFLP